MITIRVVGQVTSAQRTNAPAAPHILAHPPSPAPLSMLLVSDTRSDAMAGIRDHTTDGTFLPVQTKAVRAFILVPECCLETPPEIVGLLPQRRRTIELAKNFEV